MGLKNNICKKVVDDLIEGRIPFSYKEAQDKVLAEGGILRPFVGTTMGEYLSAREEKGLVKFRKVSVLENWNEEKREYSIDEKCMFVPYSAKVAQSKS